MFMEIVCILVFAVSFPCVMASSIDQQSSQMSAWGFDLIPTLILFVTLILSLEIWDLPRLSQPLAAALLIALWLLVLDAPLQLGSLVATLLYHSIHEVYHEWTRGFPCLFQPNMGPQKVRLWSRFWLRVFVWGSTLATTNVFVVSTIHPTFYLLEMIPPASLVTVYCESTESLLQLYFSDTSPRDYDWRQRHLLYTTSLLLGMLRCTSLWSSSVAILLQYVHPVPLAVAITVLMILSVSIEGPQVVASLHRIQTTLGALVRVKKKTPRKSFLYRGGSDVEVVGMVMHYQAYDFRHPHDDTARSPV